MFAEAVQKHDQAIVPPSANLAQQLLSSTVLTRREGIQAVRNAKDMSNALHPARSSSLNGPRPQGSFNTTNSLKRFASEMGSKSTWGHDTTTAPKAFKTPALKRGSLAHGSGMVGKLHEGVYFDENDFADDADLDLDEEFDLPTVQLKSNTTSQSQSTNTLNKAPATKSSAPGNMSTSPARLEDQPRGVPPLSETITQLESESEYEEAVHHATKRRKLPWGTSRGDHTPSPENSKKTKSPYPWNKTASAFKEEAKAFRRTDQGKKIIKSKAEDAVLPQEEKKKQAFEAISLSSEQRAVLRLVEKESKSVFFTGSAGTGKSVLMREIIKVLRNKYRKEPDRVAVTASTGLAACNVGGVTLHSFAGFGLGKEPVEELVKKIKRNAKAKSRWIRTRVLIVDEISMVDGDLFDKLEAIARILRNSGRPFGGIQLVITGDFFQLPPVPDFNKVAKFAFDAATWPTAIQHTIGLSQVFRQRDPVFADMLNQMRLGRLTQESINAFCSLSRPLNFKDNISATELFPTRNEVDSANILKMRQLAGIAQEFSAVDGGSIIDVNHRAKLLSNCMAPQTITLKKGAQVMLIKNMDESLVNGSIGTVIAFMDENKFEYHHQHQEEFQGDDLANTDDENSIRGRLNSKGAASREIASSGAKWPLVRFVFPDGTSRQLLCQPESWKFELPNGEIQACRSQVPLILAWALSIHKAQGQTLERVKVDLGKIFEKGQAYVALSRATCQEGLQVTNFNPKKVMAHEKVRAFYDSLYNVEKISRSSEASGQGMRAKAYEEEFNRRISHQEEEDSYQDLY